MLILPCCSPQVGCRNKNKNTALVFTASAWLDGCLLQPPTYLPPPWPMPPQEPSFKSHFLRLKTSLCHHTAYFLPLLIQKFNTQKSKVNQKGILYPWPRSSTYKHFSASDASLPFPFSHTHAHMYTCTHAYSYITHIHLCADTNSTHTLVHIYKCTHVHICTYTHI